MLAYHLNDLFKTTRYSGRGPAEQVPGICQTPGHPTSTVRTESKDLKALKDLEYLLPCTIIIEAWCNYY